MAHSAKERLASLAIPVGAVARIAGVRPWDISHFFIDRHELPIDKREAIDKAIEDCIWIQQAARETFPQHWS